MAAIFVFSRFWYPPRVPSDRSRFWIIHTYRIKNVGDVADTGFYELWDEAGTRRTRIPFTLKPGEESSWMGIQSGPVAQRWTALVKGPDETVHDRRDFTITIGDWIRGEPRLEASNLTAPKSARAGEEVGVYIDFRHLIGEENCYIREFRDLDTGGLAWLDFTAFGGYESRKDVYFTLRMPNHDWHLEFTVVDCLPEGCVIKPIDFTVLLATSTIMGHVTDTKTGLPISAARVECPPYSTTTDEHGYYEFKDIPPAVYTVTASAAGYRTQSKDVNASEPGTYIVDFAMEREIIPPIEWLPIAVGGFAPIIFGLTVIGYTELTKKR